MNLAWATYSHWTHLGAGMADIDQAGTRLTTYRALMRVTLERGPLIQPARIDQTYRYSWILP